MCRLDSARDLFVLFGINTGKVRYSTLVPAIKLGKTLVTVGCTRLGHGTEMKRAKVRLDQAHAAPH